MYFHCIDLYSSNKDLLIRPSVTTQLLSPVALVQQATYVIDQIQKEKEKVLCVAILLFTCFDWGHFFSHVAVKSAKT
jgi:hypothetical protein